MAAGDRRKGPVFFPGHIRESHHALGATAGEALVGVIVGVVNIPIDRVASIVQTTADAGTDFFDIISR